MKLNNGEEFTLPTDISTIKIAPPGENHFESTGEVVVNPDFMTSWTYISTQVIAVVNDNL